MSEAKKCSLKKHSEINAIYYCEQCNIYMCNKCSNLHSDLFENHINYELGKQIINTGLCQEKEHKVELRFYCKNHNKLCCAICISKIKGDEYGQHTDCEVYKIEEIADEKIKSLKNNIKYLEDISLNIKNSMDELQKIINKIDENKEKLKIKISKIFTKLRNAINDRENELLLDIDNKFSEFIFDEKIIKQNEKLPNKIKEYLEKGKNIENEWKNNNNKLNIFINDCINIENSMKNIKIIKENIENFNSKKICVKFSPEQEEKINNIINDIKSFGQIIKKENSTNYISNLNSLIINENKNYNKLLKSWINNNKIIKAELLYRLTRDGDKVSKFHELCDNQGSTLTLFCTSDGNVGGIFTPISWDTTSRAKCDTETFMFNLNKTEKYNHIGNKTSIWCLDYFGPWTVCFGFINTMKKIEHTGINVNIAYERGAEILPNNTEKIVYFDINEVEIYKISIEEED
jgi:hypothetical protein